MEREKIFESEENRKRVDDAAKRFGRSKTGLYVPEMITVKLSNMNVVRYILERGGVCEKPHVCAYDPDFDCIEMDYDGVKCHFLRNARVGKDDALVKTDYFPNDCGIDDILWKMANEYTIRFEFTQYDFSTSLSFVMFTRMFKISNCGGKLLVWKEMETLTKLKGFQQHLVKWKLSQFQAVADELNAEKIVVHRMAVGVHLEHFVIAKLRRYRETNKVRAAVEACVGNAVADDYGVMKAFGVEVAVDQWMGSPQSVDDILMPSYQKNVAQVEEMNAHSVAVWCGEAEKCDHIGCVYFPKQMSGYVQFKSTEPFVHTEMSVCPPFMLEECRKVGKYGLTRIRQRRGLYLLTYQRNVETREMTMRELMRDDEAATVMYAVTRGCVISRDDSQQTFREKKKKYDRYEYAVGDGDETRCYEQMIWREVEVWLTRWGIGNYEKYRALPWQLSPSKIKLKTPWGRVMTKSVMVKESVHLTIAAMISELDEQAVWTKDELRINPRANEIILAQFRRHFRRMKQIACFDYGYDMEYGELCDNARALLEFDLKQVME